MKGFRITLGTLASGIAALLVVLAAFLIAAAIHSLGGNGTMTGAVAHLERSGVLFQTWEGRLADGSSFSVDASSPHRDYVLFLLEESLHSGQPVTLHYVRDFTAAPWRGATPTLVIAAIQHTPTSHADETASPPPAR